MNKRFSTLVASALLATMFSANIAAQTTAATGELKAGTFYLIGDGTNGFLSADKVTNTASTKEFTILNGTGLTTATWATATADAQAMAMWSVETVLKNGAVDGFKLKNKATGKYLTLNDATALPAAADANDPAVNQFTWFDDADANGKIDASEITATALTMTTNGVKLEASAATSLASGATALNLYVIDPIGITAKDLNDNMGAAFKLSFKKKADLKDALTVEANPFTSNTIKAVAATGKTAADAATTYFFRVSGAFEGFTNAAATTDEIKAFRASQFIAVDTLVYGGNTDLDGTLGKGYKYIVVKGSDMVTTDGKFYGASTVTGLTAATTDNLAVTRSIENAQFSATSDVNIPKALKVSAAFKAPAKTYTPAKHILVDHTVSATASVTVIAFNGKNYVTTGSGVNTYLTLGGSNIVPQKDLLGIVNITSNDKYNSATKNTYGKVFGPVTTDLATTQDANRVQFNKPEGQFVITSTGDGKFKFTNRESRKAYTAAGLYYTETPGVYANGGDTIKITAVTPGDKYDGYKNYSAKVELEKTAFNVAVYSAVTDNVYLTEKHTAGHFVGLSSEKANAVNWRLVKFEEGKVTGDNAHANDSIFITNKIGYVNSDKEYKDKDDSIVAFAYALYNEANGEFLNYNADKRAYYCDPNLNKIDQARSAARFVIKQKGEGVYNLINTTIDADSPKLYGAFSDDKLTQNQATSTEGMYYLTDNDLFVIEPVDAPNYRPLATFDTISIYKEGNEKIALYERNNFLGMQHMADVPKMAAAMFVDTAFVRGNTNKPQYLLAVNAKRVISDDWCGVTGHVQHKADTTFGRFLVNMVDSAYAYGFDKHDNPYVWENNQSYKLAFMNAFHTNDTLFIQRANNVVGDSIWVGKDNNEAIGKYAFRYIDRSAKSFIIETQTRNAAGELTLGFVKWLNGTPAVITGRDQAEVFNMNEDEKGIPTDNETIGTTEVSVIAGNGQVVINNAAGKSVVISNILGQTIAQTVLTSDNATIAVPAGIVVVAIEGEAAVKAIIK